ncbi:MAG: hypothetical protein N2Z73_04695 [Endomicrobia bacterium]|nr:hypothetical protein [Endomicrobiia bacterium]
MKFKDDIYKYLPIKVKLEFFIDKELSKKRKLYKRQKLAELLKVNYGSLRNSLSVFINSGKIARILIDGKTYVGNPETIRKIKEFLIE